MDDERTVPLTQLTPEANAAFTTAVVRDCLAKEIPPNAELKNRFTETANGDLRIRTFMGETQVSEVIVEKTQWQEVKVQ
jgi:hypothetical protein